MDDLKGYLDIFSGYAELRMQKDRSANVSYLNGRLISNNQKTTSGVSSRVLVNGSWGFASNADVNSYGIERVIKCAVENAQFLDSMECKKKLNLNNESFSYVKDFSMARHEISQKDYIQFIKEVDLYVQKKCKRLTNRKIALKFTDSEKILRTSGGVFYYYRLPTTNLLIDFAINEGNQAVELSNVLGGIGYLEDNFINSKNLYFEIDKLYEELIEKSNGIYADGGIKEVVLDSEVTGILAHEAIGHIAEADIVLKGAISKKYLGKEIASPLVSVVDFANTYNGITCPMPIYVDDEGTKAKDAVIIKDGILNGFMHNKTTALEFNCETTGNARAAMYSDEPIVRMRNTAILPGTSKIKNMISSIEDGYYLVRTNNGQADINGRFVFGIILGYKIKNGKVCGAIKDTLISGMAFDVLKSVTMVGDNMRFYGAGKSCVKSQLIPIAIGGPPIKCRVNVGIK